MYMKYIEQYRNASSERYASPMAFVMLMQNEGVLCQSLGGDNGVGNDPYEDGGSLPSVSGAGF